MNSELKYQIALSLLSNIGDVLAKTLLAYCGSTEEIFKQRKSALLKIPGIGNVSALTILNHKVFDRAEEEIAFIKKNNISPLFFLDENYPARLKHCADSPVMLYFKGNQNLNAQKILSIVGTRQPTNYGKRICNKLVEDLAVLFPDMLIVSGLAYGIDFCAHKAAMENNLNTLAILGHGLDRIYPSLHAALAEKMLDNGGWLSEFTSLTKPDFMNFPKRNRIIAGIADATVVVESKREGGSLITADIANSYSRDVFAFPGRVDDFCSEGCNYLIKINKAALALSAKDIVYIMGWEEKKKEKKAPVQKSLFLEMSPEESLLIDTIKEKGSVSIDDLSLATKIKMSKVSALLLNLEFSGMVKSLPGKLYVLN